MGLAQDAPHGPSSPALPAERVKAIVEATPHTTPPAATHWSVRSMAKAQGVSKSTVQRIWAAHGLQPHRVETFKLSRDTRFVEKLTDGVGVCLNPPGKASSLCVDEKSQSGACAEPRSGYRQLAVTPCPVLTIFRDAHGGLVARSPPEDYDDRGWTRIERR